ncbi:MAG: hypothetical protein AB2693_17260 [Candidatus Thiodiazotropha sp.]
MRGGVCIAAKRYARANNSRVEGYDPEKTHKPHSLPGRKQPLWLGDEQAFGFCWVEDCEWLGRTIAVHPANSPEGFILEVNLEYPRELHAAHKDYPLVPERMLAKKEWLSEYQLNLLGERGCADRG